MLKRRFTSQRKDSIVIVKEFLYVKDSQGGRKDWDVGLWKER
jgi:hypothetical protein